MRYRENNILSTVPIVDMLWTLPARVDIDNNVSERNRQRKLVSADASRHETESVSNAVLTENHPKSASVGNVELGVQVEEANYVPEYLSQHDDERAEKPAIESGLRKKST